MRYGRISGKICQKPAIWQKCAVYIYGGGLVNDNENDNDNDNDNENDNGRMTECHEACDDSGFIPTKECDHMEPITGWRMGNENDNENDNDNDNENDNRAGAWRDGQKKTQFSQTALPS